MLILRVVSLSLTKKYIYVLHIAGYINKFNIMILLLI